MSTPKIHINPLAKKNHSNEHRNKGKNKFDQFAQKFSWVIVLVFSLSTFTALGLIFNEIKGSIGLAAQDLTAYNSWKVQYGLNPANNDANWNQSGDGVSNYNKYLLGLSLNTTVDGSVIASNVGSTSGTMPDIAGSSDPTVSTLQANGPSLGGKTTNTSSGTTTSGTTTSSGSIQPNIGGGTTLSANNPTGQVPTISNPTPSAGGKINTPSTGSSSSGTTNIASNGSTTVAGSSSSGTTVATNSSSSTSNALNTTNSGTVKTSGSTTSTDTQNSGTTKTSGTTATTKNLATKKSVTDRTGGEFNLILFLAGLASLASGAYILRNKFVKNSLAVHEGEK